MIDKDNDSKACFKYSSCDDEAQGMTSLTDKQDQCVLCLQGHQRWQHLVIIVYLVLHDHETQSLFT